MKEEDKRIEYRPELAKKLQEAMDFAIDIYSVNIKKAYYSLVAKAYEDEDREKSDFIKEAAKCFDDTFAGAERFHRDFDRDLVYKYHVEPFSYTNAGMLVFPVYRSLFEDLEKDCMSEDLSKVEKHMIKSFFEKLTAPLHNPNVVPDKSYGKCYYDETNDPFRSFERSMRDSIEYIKENCPYTIDVFSIPDDLEYEY